MNMSKRVLVYQQRSKLKPTGGPAAVGFYYATEQERRGDHFFEYLSDFTSYSELHENESRRIEKMPKWLQKVYQYSKQIVKFNILLGGKYKLDPVDFSKYDIIHFHDTQGLYLRRYDLANYKGIVILQSHSPQPLGQEMLDVIPKTVRFFVPFAKKRFEKMDRFAFNRADIIVFPCPEAEEPYFNTWPYYSIIHKTKETSYRYVLTGIPAACPRISREEIRNSTGIPENDFMICYVGRHNSIKGYDSLKRIGERVLLNNKEVWVVCAGKEEPLRRLQHPHWLEIGWTNDAHSYISASDVFVLPNKETYFDIVMLEILSLGKIVVASRTGGNKYFERNNCRGVFLYDTEDEAVEILQRINKMSLTERESLGRYNKEFYNKYHTVSAMYDQYVELLNSIVVK